MGTAELGEGVSAGRSAQAAAEGWAPPQAVTAGATSAFKRRWNAAGLALDSARAAVSGLDRGGTVFGLTKGQFSMIDLAAAVLARTGMADVSVWTWCIAEYEVEAFTAFFNEWRIRRFRLVIDWAGAQRDMPLVAELQARFGADCIRVTKTHAKIATVATDDGWRVCIRGSMNLNANPRFEQFDISDGPEAFDVVAGVERELWERWPALPVRALTHAAVAETLTEACSEAPKAPGWWSPAAKGSWW